MDSLETRFGAALTALLQENPSSQLPKRSHLLRIMVRFGGDVEYVRKYFKKIQDKQNPEQIDSIAFRRKHQEEIKTKYATQLAELASSGINVNCPSVLSRLEKSHGDVEKVEFSHKINLNK